MKLLVDTSVWSLALRRKKTASLNPDEQKLKAEPVQAIQDGRVAMLGLLRQELLSGIKEKAQFDKVKAALDPYLGEPINTADYEYAITSLLSILQCRAHGPYIQKHLLRAILCAPFNRNEPITCVPSSFVAVRIRDDAATADVLRNPQNGLECFGDQCVAETPAAEAFVNGQPGQQN